MPEWSDSDLYIQDWVRKLLLFLQLTGPAIELSFSGKVKGKGILFNVGGQAGKDCLLTWAESVKVADHQDRARKLAQSFAPKALH